MPLTWLAATREHRAQWWGVAAAFGVSGIADVLSYGPHPLVAPWIMATVYPVGQVGLLVVALADRHDAQLYIGLLAVVGVLTVLTEGVTGPTLFLETVAAGCAVSVAWNQPKRLRATLLYAFGVGWLAWVGYTISPGWLSWGLYQGIRLVSVVMFCWASVEEPVLA